MLNTLTPKPYMVLVVPGLNNQTFNLMATTSTTPFTSHLHQFYPAASIKAGWLQFSLLATSDSNTLYRPWLSKYTTKCWEINPCPSKTMTNQDKQIFLNPEYHVWLRHDQLIIHALLSSLSNSMIPMIVRSTSSQWAITKLTNVFSSRTRSRIMALKWNFPPPHKTIRELNNIST